MSFPESTIVFCAEYRDENSIFISHLFGTAEYDRATLKPYFIWSEEGSVGSASYSADRKHLVTTSMSSNEVIVWNPITVTPINILKGHSDFVLMAAFSKDGTKIVTASFDKTAKIWDTSTGQLLGTLTGHNNCVTSASFSPDGKYIITSSDDNTHKVWNLKTSALVYTLIPLDDNEFVAQTNQGYYHGTKQGVKLLHYVNDNLKVISFEQLDVKYNRPDKVLQAIGRADTSLIKSYNRAYSKRIKRLGIDTTNFKDNYVPEADFTNRNFIESIYEQKEERLELNIKGKDEKQLSHFNVWVNEVPLYGQKGIDIRKKMLKEFEHSVVIKLSEGMNTIETSFININGIESYRIPLIVKFSPKIKHIQKILFVGIGIEKFSNAKYNLNYCTKDIRDIAKKLKERHPNIQIDTLFNQNVTIKNIKALKKKLLESNVNDKVIIAYSGHGLLSKDYNYYLSTYSVDFEKPEQNGLHYDILENLLDSIPARKKLMLIDACHSGELDKEDLEMDYKRVSQSKNTPENKKGTEAPYNLSRFGLQNSIDLMQTLFLDVSKSTGSNIISAATGTQFAIESNKYRNGVFTYSILEAMKKHTSLKISDLKKIVENEVGRLTQGKQKPTSRNETISIDWEL